MVGDAVDLHADGDPLVQAKFAPLEDDSEFLAVESRGLVEAVVEVDEDAVGVSGSAGDLFDEVGAWAGGLLGGEDASGAEPVSEEVEEVNAVLDEDAAAFGGIPEPVVRKEGFVFGFVDEEGVEGLAEETAVDDALHGRTEWVVTHDEVDSEEALSVMSRGGHFLGVGEGGGERLFAEDVLTGGECFEDDVVMRERGRCDVDDIYVVASEEVVDGVSAVEVESRCGVARGVEVGVGESDDADVVGGGVLLEAEESERTGADEGVSKRGFMVW